MTPEALHLLRPYLDAANVDLKAFTDEFYKTWCSARLAPDALLTAETKEPSFSDETPPESAKAQDVIIASASRSTSIEPRRRELCLWFLLRILIIVSNAMVFLLLRAGIWPFRDLNRSGCLKSPTYAVYTMSLYLSIKMI